MYSLAVGLAETMTNTAQHILSTLNAPYAKKVSATELAVAISTEQPAPIGFGQALSFFSELPSDLQLAFIAEMKLDISKVTLAAKYHFNKLGHSRFPL
jgi:hypothetical protein